MRVGLGYDVHMFVEGRPLILGGVVVPFEKGLKGHSDADVLVHAVCDAVLGAAGMGDIGEHFPDTDDKFLNISSLKLLDRVQAMAEEKGFCCVNLDTVIVAQRPKMAEYLAAMKLNIAKSLKISACNVNIKATTTEGLGFEGRQEGIGAQAVVLMDSAG